MTSTRPQDTGRPASPRLSHLVATGSIITVAFMGSVIVTPLYSVYQAEFGFSDLTLTLVYAAYAIGNVVALLLFGQISDQVGRRAAALSGLLLAAASALTFLLAEGTPWLYAGRILIGLAVGILSGTGTAWLAEHLDKDHRSQATVIASTSNLLGIATGPAIGGLLAEYAPRPLVVPFLVYLLLVVVVTGSVLRTPDRGRQVGRLRDVRVRVRLGVPRDLLAGFAAPGVAGFVTFALGGLYFALIPGIVIRDLHVRNVAVGGLIVCQLAAIAVVCLVLGRRVAPRLAMRIGLLSLLPAVGLVVGAQAARSMLLLLVATVFAGVTLSFGYRGSLEIVNLLAPDERRAEMVSTYFMACFAGNSLPVIGIGILTTFTDPIIASSAFAATVALLALGAMLWYRRSGDEARLLVGVTQDASTR